MQILLEWIYKSAKGRIINEAAANRLRFQGRKVSILWVNRERSSSG